MPRPTDEKKGKMLKIRISDELYEELSRKGKNLSETVREILKGGGNVPQNDLPYGIDMADLDDLNTMAMFCGGSVGAMIHLLDEGMNDGSLSMENGRIVGKPVIDLDNFLEACHDAGVDPQKVLDKATKGIGR